MAPRRAAMTAAAAAVAAEQVDAGPDPLGDRRVRHPVEAIRQQNPGQEVERCHKSTFDSMTFSTKLEMNFRSPMSEHDPRLRYYSKLRTMFRSSAYEGTGVHPRDGGGDRVLEEEEEEVHADNDDEGDQLLQRGGINDPSWPPTLDPENPFDSFLVMYF